MNRHSVLHVLGDLHLAAAAELVAYTIAGTDNVIEAAPDDVSLEQWISAALVLIEEDVADYLTTERPDLLPRGRVVLLSHTTHDRKTWARAVAVGVDDINHLPDDTDRLVTHIRSALTLAGL